MSAILTIMKKEFARFFGDKRLILSILLPGLIIYAVYTAMGSITQSFTETPVQAVVCVRNMPQSLSQAVSSVFIIDEGEGDDEALKERIREGDLDLLVIFPEDFDEAIAENALPDVSIYYNSGDTASSSAYYAMTALLNSFEESISDVLTINRGEGQFDLADSGALAKDILSMIVPMVLIMLLFSGCIAVVLESIAGEKERGTFATMLVTPVKRTYIAAGKILSLSALAMLSGLSSFLGLIFSIPSLIGGLEGISFTMYGFTDYLLIFLVIIMTVLVLVALLSIVSAFAKSTKEANGLMAPVMILVLLCSVVSMFVPNTAIGIYFVPVLNSAMCISSIMSGALSVAAFLITIGVNLAFTLLLAVVLAFMFNSEKIIFNG